MKIVAPRRYRDNVLCHGTHRIELVDGKGECPNLNIGELTFLEAQGFRFETDEPGFSFDEPTDTEPAKTPRRRGRDETDNPETRETA